MTSPEAVLGVDLGSVRPQVCAAGADRAGLGPGVSQPHNSLSLCVSLQRKSVPAWLFFPCKQQSPALRFFSVSATRCHCYHSSLCHPPAEGRELRRAGASSCRIQEDAAPLFKEVRGVGAGAGGSVSPEETEVACFGWKWRFLVRLCSKPAAGLALSAGRAREQG